MLKKLFLVLLLLGTVSACTYDEGTEVTTTGVPGIGRRGPESISAVDEAGEVDDSGDLAGLGSGDGSNADNANGAGLNDRDSLQADLAKAGDRVLFGLDSSTLTAEAQEILNRQASWLNAHPHVTVTIEGHCDERGTREYNLALGDRRAIAVKTYLVSRGVSEGRVNTISYGKERPVALSSEDQSWSVNRRGVTVVN